MFVYKASDKLVFNILKSINYGYLEITSIEGDILKFGNPEHDLKTILSAVLSKNINFLLLYYF